MVWNDQSIRICQISESLEGYEREACDIRKSLGRGNQAPFEKVLGER